MNIKDFFANRENPPELYWSLVIEAGWVQAGIWYIGESAAEVISVSPGAAWETEDELTGAVDAALSSAIQKLPEDTKEPDKTVFGVSSGWVEGGEIKEEYLEKIKKLCGELSLTPVGFVVLPEAIAHLYKSEEGSPLSAVVLGLGKEFLEISVFKLGNLAGVTQVARSVSLIEDVTEGLSRFEGASPLPSRFVIYDGKGAELTEAKDALMGESWEGIEKVSFLHSPKVETLESERKVLATSLAGANEIGQVSKIASRELPIAEADEGGGKEEIENVKPPIAELAPEDLGFALGEDVTEGRKVEEKLPERPLAAPHQEEIYPHTNPVGVGMYMQRTKSLFHGFTGFSRKLLAGASAVKPKVGKGSLTTLGIAAVFIIAILGILWWFLPKATVTIYVSPKTFQEQSSVSFDTTGKFDISSSTVPASTVTADVSGDKTKATSGTKLIGDKAKGSVQIQNGTAFPINLSAGTILISSANLNFTLDNSASVSAALTPGSPGTANDSVTASTIGADYNLAKDEVFKVGNYPKAEVDAVAQSDFSGGSSQQISAVSKDDQTALETQLKDELTQNAKGQLSQKVTDNQIFVSDLAGITVNSENFDHKVGDQADSLKLSLDITATGIAADKTDLLEFARAALKDKIPSGFVLRDSQIAFQFTFDSHTGSTYFYHVGLGANFLPQVDTGSIINQIVGKTPGVTESYLSSVPGFTRADVTLSPHLPGFLGTLPHIGKNITIQIVAEQ